MELNGLKIHCLGDSITQGIGVSAIDKCYVSRLAAEYGAITKNYGISGTRIARQKNKSENASFDNDFCARVAEMDADADLIVVFGGTNDYGHGDAPIGAFEDRTPDTFYGALHTLYTSLIEKYPHAKILVLTPLHRLVENDVTSGGHKPSGTWMLRDYVQCIRRVAEYYSIPVLDLYAAGGMQPAVAAQKELYMPDGLHPNDAGHVLLTQRIAQFIQYSM